MSDRNKLRLANLLNEDMPIISIITVCWNESPERIKLTMNSIDSQAYPHLEKVIVDGESQPSTINALKPYINVNTVFISESDGGIFDAMNKGISLAKGDYVIFMNIGDRFHHNDVIKKTIAMIQKEPFCDIYYGDSVSLQNCDDDRSLTLMPDTLNRRWLFQKTICHQSIIFARKCFDLYGIFDLRYSLLADREWLLRALNMRCTYKHVSLVICDFELGGACSDWKRVGKELALLRNEYFFATERYAFGIYWFLYKCIMRMISCNYRVPVSCRLRR